MKVFILVILVASLGLAGCNGDSNVTKKDARNNEARSNEAEREEISAIDKAGIKDARRLVRLLKDAVDRYYQSFGSFPADLNGLITGPTDPNQAKRFRKGEILPADEIPLDLWGSKYAMIVDEETKSAMVYSYGPNAKDERGKGDDIASE